MIKKINTDTKLKEWNSSIDLVRIFALLLVNAIHFFLWSEFYSMPINGIKMFVFVNIRIFSMSCVPLFLIITGYLMKDKRLCLKHYFGLVRILVMYIICGVICLLFQTLFEDCIPGLTPYAGIKKFISLLLSFDLVPYGWYVAMYIGLFCMIPFLNLIYNNLKSKKQKICLCVVFITLTTLPSLLNNFNIFQDSFHDVFFNKSTKYTIILTDAWKTLYPLTYYFIGCYLREYPLKINKGVNLLLILFLLLTFGLYTYISYEGSAYIIGDIHQWWSIITLAISSLIFNFFININLSNIGRTQKRVLKKLSSYVFCAYMLSFIFDMIIYAYLKSEIALCIDRLSYFPICVFLVFVFSLCLSALVNLLYDVIISIINKFRKHTYRKR